MTDLTLRKLYGHPPENMTRLDAFARAKVSNPATIFDSKQLYDSQPLFWDDQEVSGSGTSSVHSVARASTTIGVGAHTAGHRVRQTKRRFNYQPGKAQEILLTGVLGAPKRGVTKRIGYFDDNNGVFFQQDAAGLAVGIRSSVSGSMVQSLVYQSAWNIDPMDGNGLSGINLDQTKSQIFYIDLEWLGVGSVRFALVTDGLLDYVHQVNHANIFTSVYMSTPNLPLRYEIISDGSDGAATLEHICSTVQSDGGVDPLGVTRGIDRGVTGFATGSNTLTYPLISVRLKTTHLSATVIPLSQSIIVSSNANFRWALVLNPTVAGVDAASWTALSNSAVEYDVSRTNVNTLTGGTVLASGYGSDTLDAIAGAIDPTLLLGATIAGVRDELVLAVQNLTAAGAETYFASLIIRELL